VLVNLKSVMEALNKNISELDPKFLELVLNGALGALLKNQASFAPGKIVLSSLEVDTSVDGGFQLNNDHSIRATIPSTESDLDTDVDVSPVEIIEWCNGVLGMMLILTNCTHVRIRKAFLDQFERLVMSSIESNIGRVMFAFAVFCTLACKCIVRNAQGWGCTTVGPTSS
jgi:hypothetical protein